VDGTHCLWLPSHHRAGLSGPSGSYQPGGTCSVNNVNPKLRNKGTASLDEPIPTERSDRRPKLIRGDSMSNSNNGFGIVELPIMDKPLLRGRTELVPLQALLLLILRNRLQRVFSTDVAGCQALSSLSQAR
jgi:hypothetical protein